MKKIYLLFGLLLCSCDQSNNIQQKKDKLEIEIFSICKDNLSLLPVAQVYKDSVCSCQAEMLSNFIISDPDNITKLKTSELYKQKVAAMATRFVIECDKKYEKYKYIN